MLRLIFWPKCCRRKANIVQSAVAQSSSSLNSREKQTIHQGGERFKTKKCSGGILKKEEKEVGGKGKSWQKNHFFVRPTQKLFTIQCHDRNTKKTKNRNIKPQILGNVSPSLLEQCRPISKVFNGSDRRILGNRSMQKRHWGEGTFFLQWGLQCVIKEVSHQ